LTGADIESVCKKATLCAIVEFQNSVRVAPFVVMRNDFLAVLGSDRGGPKRSKTINERSNGAGNLYADTFSNTRY
jgi:hypothetical protein